MYSFTFKTHYCYQLDGSRFHGDCTKHIQNAEQSSLHSVTVESQEFDCHIVQLEKQYQQAHYFNNFGACEFIIPTTVYFPLIVVVSDRQNIPMFSCRGGPPLQTLSLRGPPVG